MQQPEKLAGIHHQLIRADIINLNTDGFTAFLNQLEDIGWHLPGVTGGFQERQDLPAHVRCPLNSLGDHRRSLADMGIRAVFQIIGLQHRGAEDIAHIMIDLGNRLTQ